MIVKLDVDLIKSYLKNYPVKSVIWDENNIKNSLSELIIDGSRLWYPGYKGYLEYRELEDGTLAVKALDGATLPNFIKIPSSHDGKIVTMIDNGAFIDASFVGAIIPDTISIIGHYAFSNCSNLQIINGSMNYLEVNEIGAYAFSGCNNLRGIVLEAGTLETIGDEAFSTNVFYNYDKNTWDRWVTRGSGNYSVYFLSDEAIYDGKHWNQQSRFPTVWGSYCDRNGHSESRHSVKATCTEYGYEIYTCGACGERVGYYTKPLGHDWSDWIYDEATGIAHIECKRCGEYRERGEQFEFILLSDDTYAVKAKDFIPNIVIPSTHNGKRVTTIADYAFEYSEIISVTIPDTITTIGSYAFAYCSHLAEVNISEDSKLKYINRGAFYECTEITQLHLPDGLEIIGDEAFALSSIDIIGIPDTVTSIGRECFYDSYLREIIFCAGINLTHINESTFEKCSLLSSVTIPRHVEVIAERAFYGCQNLTNVNFESYSRIAYIMERAFSMSGITNISIPEGCIAILDGAFSWCGDLAGINLPSTLVSIGEESAVSVFQNTAYYNNANNWVDGVLYIDGYLITVKDTETNVRVASNCYSIATGAVRNKTLSAVIKIPLSVGIIQPRAFTDCEDLTIYCEAPSKPEGWADDWHDGSVTVVWSYTEDTSTYILTENGEYLTDEQGNILMIEGD